MTHDEALKIVCNAVEHLDCSHLGHHPWTFHALGDGCPEERRLKEALAALSNPKTITVSTDAVRIGDEPDPIGEGYAILEVGEITVFRWAAFRDDDDLDPDSPHGEWTANEDEAEAGGLAFDKLTQSNRLDAEMDAEAGGQQEESQPQIGPYPAT